MRTTLNIPDELLAQLKKVAAASRRTLTAVIEDALREALARRRRGARPGRVSLTTFGGSGVHPGVDLDDTAALIDVMDAVGGPDRR